MPLFKGVSGKAKPHKAIEYITAPDKAALVDAINMLPGKTYAECFMETAAFFGKNQERDDRKYYHFKFSPNPEDRVSPEVCQKAAMELAKEQFPEFECVVATHIDTGVVHSHIIINSVNFETGLKFHASTAVYAQMKDYANEVGKRYEMTPLDWRSAAAVKKQLLKEGEAVEGTSVEKRIALRGGISWKEELREVIDLAKKKCDNIIAFEEYLERYGVTLSRITESNISFLHPAKEKAIRGGRLGEAYTVSAIEEALENNATPAEQQAKTTSAYDTFLAAEHIYPWYAMEATPKGLSALERLTLQQKYVLLIELRLAIRNSAWVSYDYTEFLERLENEYGVRLRETKDGTVLIHQNGTEIKASELGEEYEKEAVINVINRPKNGQDGDRNPKGDKRQGAATKANEYGARERRADNASVNKQAADAQIVRKR